jgi:hypothetical protein
MASVSGAISVLVGPTCPTCESHDRRWEGSLSNHAHAQCRDCGTEYRWYDVPPPAHTQRVVCTTDATCLWCGLTFGAGWRDDAMFCEDCELSDCAFCGVTTNRPLLSENLACQLCETGEAA